MGVSQFCYGKNRHHAVSQVRGFAAGTGPTCCLVAGYDHGEHLQAASVMRGCLGSGRCRLHVCLSPAAATDALMMQLHCVLHCTARWNVACILLNFRPDLHCTAL